ncbi:hypothetical protein OUZ56_032687 [Daphnia magna]|uniref:Uncharacterized protein n=1 Tax=Daphnia magna TaxID=35525 RepID=A0ABQ9ZWT3_9CRUS|nr:hypothetical protein OUZ56_032687 [Daphnia magna]
MANVGLQNSKEVIALSFVSIVNKTKFSGGVYVMRERDFPLMNLHVHFIVGEFSGVGSALAQTNMLFQPIRNSKIDKDNKMEASKNLFSKVSLFDQFKEIGIPPSDINVVTYGSVPIGAHVQFNPVCRTGSAILEDIENRNIEELWLKALALECYARVSVSGLSSGRNTVKQQ